MHVNETHKLPCLKRKLVYSALLCIWAADEKQIRQTQRMELFIVTYQGGVVLAGKVLHGLQPLERNKDKYIQIQVLIRVHMQLKKQPLEDQEDHCLKFVDDFW